MVETFKIISEQVVQSNSVFSVQRVTLREVSTINKFTTSHVIFAAGHCLSESEAIEFDMAFGRTRGTLGEGELDSLRGEFPRRDVWIKPCLD